MTIPTRLHLLELGLLSVLFSVPAVQAPAAPPRESPQEQLETCLSCHEDPSIEVVFEDGSKKTLSVARAAFVGSVHGTKLRCSDCHRGYEEIPHPEHKFKSSDDFTSRLRETCRTCHYQNYTRYLDGVHHRVASEGGPAPSCVDCHDAHAVTPPGKPRSRVSETCATCHSEVADQYAGSVHGKGLSGAHPEDVPVCTDCHRSHDIQDPRQAAFLLKTPETCGKCHGDEKRMAKYGLSSKVLETYLSDFHGMTATLEAPHATGEAKVTAVCVDCHGVHDIARTDAPGSLLKANVVRTCQKCHPDASGNFPEAWLSHFEPSWSKAPLVYAIKQFYSVFIPFVIGGLVLQILLHFWRVVVNR